MSKDPTEGFIIKKKSAFRKILINFLRYISYNRQGRQDNIDTKYAQIEQCTKYELVA